MVGEVRDRREEVPRRHQGVHAWSGFGFGFGFGFGLGFGFGFGFGLGLGLAISVVRARAQREGHPRSGEQRQPAAQLAAPAQGKARTCE